MAARGRAPAGKPDQRFVLVQVDVQQLARTTAILVLIGYILLQKGSKPIPEQAFEEAELTAEALRDAN